MSQVIGIDFGTTNSLCAWMDGDRPALLPNRRGSRLTPSVVAMTAKGELLVGESAKNQAVLNPDHTIAAIKRRLGSGVPIAMGGRSWRPEELAALIFSSLRQDAETHLGTEVGAAVVTVPANFSDRERRAVLEAGSLAGLKILRLVNESTAAAVARAWTLLSSQRPSRPSLVLVYDFGGGTFDVSLLEQDGSDCRVRASRGDGRLGGTDLDEELRRIASAAFLREYGLDVEADRFLAQQLSEAAEGAKIELSEREESTIGIPFAVAGGPQGDRIVHPQCVITRSRLEELAAPYLARSLELTEATLADAGVRAEQVDSLVLSGGTSRMPLVRRMLAQRLGLKPDGGINPEEIVALGAAAWATLLDGSTRLRVHDVVSRSYGIEIDGGSFVPLIAKNCPVPASRSRLFTTVSDGQDAVEIHVLQGESRTSAENLSLGRFLLSGIRDAGKGEPRIKVQFSIDESDLLRVSAVDLDSGSEQAISIADIGRGASAQGREHLLATIALLAQRLGELRAGLSLERTIEAELQALRARADAAEGKSSLAEGALRLLKAELEGLVGELLARHAERRNDERRGDVRHGDEGHEGLSQVAGLRPADHRGTGTAGP